MVFSVLQKTQIIELVDTIPTSSVKTKLSAIKHRLNIDLTRSTLHRIISKRDIILDQPTTRKKLITASQNNFEKALKSFLEDKFRSCNLTLDNIKTFAAGIIARDFPDLNLKLSKNYCRNFLRAQGFNYKRVKGDKLWYPERKLNEIRAELEALYSNYDDCNVFNLDESCFRLNEISNHSWMTERNEASGRTIKSLNETMTIAAIISLAGKLHDLPIVLAKHRPRGLNMVPLNDTSKLFNIGNAIFGQTKRGWMVRDTFAEILERINSQLEVQGTKGLMIVDRASSHILDKSELKNFDDDGR